MNSLYYVGITIGPILDTFQTATFPAALWFASNFFSDLTRRLCVKITALGNESTFSDLTIYSPNFNSENNGISNDGIGKYHDRIVFRINADEEVLKQRLNQIITEVKEESLENFDCSMQEKKTEYASFLNRYLQINYCLIPCERLNGESPILKLSPYLDSLELMKTFCANDSDNPFVSIFLDDRSKVNTRIRQSKLFSRIIDDSFLDQFLLSSRSNSDKTIRDLTDIALGRNYSEEYRSSKKSVYFALVYADGDKMGKTLEAISVDKIQAFSKACFEYNKEAAKAVGDFGGMTIYAGGDDLLFLAPLEGNVADESSRKSVRTNILGLCVKLNQIFQNALRNDLGESLHPIPTLSFGVSIQYYKYPLYEAYNNALNLLFTDAKSAPGKNSVALRLQKHSGQSTKFTASIENEISEIIKLLYFHDGEDVNAVSGAIQTLITHRRSIALLLQNTTTAESDKNAFFNAWNNFFDNEGQASVRDFTDTVANFVLNLKLSEDVRISELSGKDKPDPEKAKKTQKRQAYGLDKVIAILQYRKFLLEKKGEDDA